jgi:putative RecB family exonuclease
MPPVFSHSRLSTFENCPRQYRYRYIDRLPRPGVGIEAHVGSSVHKALESLYREVSAGRIPSLEEVQRCYQEAWQSVPPKRLRIVRRGFDRGDYSSLGGHCVDAYYRRHHPFQEGTVVKLEGKVHLSLGSDGEYRLVGYIDRLARAADGAYEIHDYKASGSLPRQQDLDRDRQLVLYEIALRRSFPAHVPVRHIWHYLAFDRRYQRIREARDLQRVARETVRGIRRVLEEKGFPARTGTLCHWCDFNEECPEGRRYLAERPPPGLPG